MIKHCFYEGDKLFLKKKHPCGSLTFTVMRTGSDVRIICDGCRRDLTLPRVKLEKMIKEVISSNDAGATNNSL